LIAAVADRDDAALTDLLNENHDAILRDFAGWTKVPAEARNDKVATARYAEAMIAVATLYERSGDGSLMAALRGQAGDNPMEDWNRQLHASQGLIDGARAGEAVDMLTALLRRIEEVPGGAREYYRPRTLGKLGTALYRAGDTRRAVQVTREARELCIQAGDAEGVKAYTGNLETMGTFEVASRDGSGARYAVVFRDDRGRMLGLDDLGNARGRLEWEIRGGPTVPPDATALHQQGREAGSRGDYAEAVSTLTKAAALAPSWPYPVYDRAFTHMLKRDFDSALADYRRTLQLAPDGFFTASQAVDMLTREAAGEFPSGLYATFITHGQVLAEAERRSIAEQIVEEYPGFTPA
jgi:tetratricopeptide (TPR) repeat protein